MPTRKRNQQSKNEEDYQRLIKRARSMFSCENEETSQLLMSQLRCLHPGLLYADNSQLLLTSHVLAMGECPMYVLKPREEEQEVDKEGGENGSRLGKLVPNKPVSEHVQNGFSKHLFTPFLDDKVSFIQLLIIANL